MAVPANAGEYQLLDGTDTDLSTIAELEGADTIRIYGYEGLADDDLAAYLQGIKDNLRIGTIVTLWESDVKWLAYRVDAVANPSSDNTLDITIDHILTAGTGSIASDQSVQLRLNLADTEPIAPQADTSGFTGSQGTTAGTINLSWDANSDATGYKVRYQNLETLAVTTVDVGNVTSYNITGLDDGVLHGVWLIPYNVGGDGAESNPLTVRAGGNFMLASPTTFSASEVTDRSAVIGYWAGSVTPGTGMRIRYSTTSDFSSDVETLYGLNDTTNTVTLRDLDDNVTYYVQIQEYDGTQIPVAYSPALEGNFTTDERITTPPTTPANLRWEEFTDEDSYTNALIVSWDATTGAETYELGHRPSSNYPGRSGIPGGNTITTGATRPSDPENGNVHIDTNGDVVLWASERDEWTGDSYGSDGYNLIDDGPGVTGSSFFVGSLTQMGQVVGDLLVQETSGVNNGKVFRWNGSSWATTGHNVFTRPRPNPLIGIVGTSVNNSTFVNGQSPISLEDLDGTVHYYRVRARNENGVSSYSAEIQVSISGLPE